MVKSYQEVFNNTSSKENLFVNALPDYLGHAFFHEAAVTQGFKLMKEYIKLFKEWKRDKITNY